jgi:hypothetical protein
MAGRLGSMPSQQPSVQYPCSIRATSVHNQFLIEAGAKVMIARVIAPDSRRL